MYIYIYIYIYNSVYIYIYIYIYIVLVGAHPAWDCAGKETRRCGLVQKLFCEPGLFRCFCTTVVEVLGRTAEGVLFPCKMTNKYRGDLRRRRIRAKAVQKHVKIQSHANPKRRGRGRVSGRARRFCKEERDR